MEAIWLSIVSDEYHNFNDALVLMLRPEMKYIIAAMYTKFATDIVDDEGVEQMDLYTAPPTSGKLIIRIRAVDS